MGSARRAGAKLVVAQVPFPVKNDDAIVEAVLAAVSSRTRLAMLVHVWKSLPFWTMISIAGWLSIQTELYEAASVDGATGLQQFRFITWPSMRTLYLTSTILSMIWTLGDFNSVYLLTGGGPADGRHPPGAHGAGGAQHRARSLP